MKNSTGVEGNFSITNRTSTTQVPEYLAIAVITFVAFCILAGTFANAGVCILLRRRQDLRKVPHYFVGSLAMIGIFSALFSMPMLIIMTAVNYFQIQDLSVAEIFCKVGFPSGYACMIVNALTLWLMAFDRHDCVLRPFNRRITTRNVKKVIAVIWILALITAVFFAISMRNEPSVCIKFYTYNRKITRHPYGIVFTIVFTLVFQLDKITFVIVIVTFFRIMRAFRSSTVNPSNSLHQRRERKLTWLTYQLCGIFLLFRVPVTIANAFKGGEFEGTEVKTARLFTIALVHFTYVANPILHRKVLKVRPPNPLGSTTRQAGDHELVQTAAGARENQNFSLEP